MTDKNSKVGLMTKDEAQFFGKLIAGEIPVKGVYKSALNFALPALLNGLDDKIGDKLPEPWQTYTEDLLTSVYNKKIFANGKEVGIIAEDDNVVFENSDLIIEQEQINEELLSRENNFLDFNDPYIMNLIQNRNTYLNNTKAKRTDEQRLKEYGIDSLDKLLEECILISQKQSKLPRSIRNIIVRISVEAFKELNLKAEEIKKESLENNTKEDDRQEQ